MMLPSPDETSWDHQKRGLEILKGACPMIQQFHFAEFISKTYLESVPEFHNYCEKLETTVTQQRLG